MIVGFPSSTFQILQDCVQIFGPIYKVGVFFHLGIGTRDTAQHSLNGKEIISCLSTLSGLLVIIIGSGSGIVLVLVFVFVFGGERERKVKRVFKINRLYLERDRYIEGIYLPYLG